MLKSSRCRLVSLSNTPAGKAANRVLRTSSRCRLVSLSNTPAGKAVNWLSIKPSVCRLVSLSNAPAGKEANWLPAKTRYCSPGRPSKSPAFNPVNPGKGNRVKPDRLWESTAAQSLAPSSCKIWSRTCGVLSQMLTVCAWPKAGSMATASSMKVRSLGRQRPPPLRVAKSRIECSPSVSLPGMKPGR